MPTGIYKRTKEHLGKLKKQGFQKGQTSYNKGKTAWNKGIKMWANKEKPKGMLGKKFTEEHKRKISEACCGSKCHFWKGGISTYKRKLWLNERRRMKKKKIDGFHAQGEWENLKAQYNWTCPACDKKEPNIVLTKDHIIPISKGGSDNIENIQPLCKSCNSKKHTQSIYYERK